MIGLVLVITLGVTPVFSQHGHDAPKGSKGVTGVLLLAHGGAQSWNDEVAKLGAVIDKTMPTEIAFGMASKRNIQQAVDKLAARGVVKIIAVPLFVSSHSSVITSTEFLLGQRAEAPPALAIFAKMDHGHGGGHTGHGTAPAAETPIDPTTPVKSSVPIRMLTALDRHPLVAEILLSRAQAISREPKKEVVILVAHGPVSDTENNQWLGDMASLAENMRGKSSFKRIEYLTVRDDAPEPIRSKAAADLRAVVKKASDEGSAVLIVPLLLSYGGIEKGVIKRLEGLEYKMSDQALLPDDRLAEWVLLSVKNSEPEGKTTPKPKS
jgi:sirohydrochlorin ferrochelatase